jgi:RluA family pseudouridine synthase
VGFLVGVVVEYTQIMDWQRLIVWQDEALVVVNKPAGLLTLPDGYDPLRPHLRAVLEPHLGRLWIVHRLDRDTSGIILLGRSAAAHRNLNRQFELHQVEKIYHAIVCGAPEWETITIDLPLRANVGRRKRTAVDLDHGKTAQTFLRRLERLTTAVQVDYSLVEARPQTGRTHQVRAHLAAFGFPVAGDPLYGPTPQCGQALIKRTALHAWQLQISHPVTEAPLTWQAPYPDDFQSALQVLRPQTGPD